MSVKCVQCDVENLPTARFCARCGHALESDGSAVRGPGRVMHPTPLPAPDGFEACQNAVHLYARWEAAWGGSVLLSTESLSLTMFNGGYALANVVLRVRGVDADGHDVYAVEHAMEALPRGDEVKVEIPSYELPAPAQSMAISLVSAEFSPEA